MITFGLTGGIACGKSNVTSTFRSHNIPIVDADIVAREVVVPGSFGLQKIIETFGQEFLLDDGNLNRPKMASLIFHNNDSLNLINSIMKPLIKEESNKQIAALHNAGHSIVGWDAALIIEQHYADKFRPLIVVACPQAMQLDRLMSRNSLTRDAAMARINAQMSTEEKVKFADYVIDTSGTIQNSIKQTEKIILKLRSML